MDFSFFIASFGCKVSQYESQAIREQWEKFGGNELDAPEQAEIILIASCAVTAEAVADARQAARKFARQAPDASIIVTGCAASAASHDFALPQVTAVIPQKEKHLLLAHHPLELGMKLYSRQAEKQTDSSILDKEFPPYRIASYNRVRPVVKVQDGCSHGCAFCIVPSIRGAARSRPVEEIVDEVGRLFAAGFRELMLSGINLRQYSFARYDFWDVLDKIERTYAGEWQGRARLRLSSLEPAQLTDKGLDILAESRLVCPHLHLSLQSGSNAVLQRMGRHHYNPGQILTVLDKLKNKWPIFGLGADFLMGFSGESQVEVEETLKLIELLPLSYAHVFPYSPRPGTLAATMPQLPKRIRQEHARLVRELVAQKQKRFLHEQLTLPHMYVVLDADSPAGVNEFYVPCLADGPENLGRNLGMAHPVAVLEDKISLLVIGA